MFAENEQYLGLSKVGDVRVLRGSSFMSPIEIIRRVEAARNLQERLDKAQILEGELGTLAGDIMKRLGIGAESPTVKVGSDAHAPFEWRLRQFESTVELVASRQSDAQVTDIKDYVVASWQDGKMVHVCQEPDTPNHESVNRLETYLSTVAAVLDSIDQLVLHPQTDV